MIDLNFESLTTKSEHSDLYAFIQSMRLLLWFTTPLMHMFVNYIEKCDKF